MNILDYFFPKQHSTEEQLSIYEENAKAALIEAENHVLSAQELAQEHDTKTNNVVSALTEQIGAERIRNNQIQNAAARIITLKPNK